MKIVLLFLVLFSLGSASAKGANSAKKKLITVSCASVKGAKRKSFKWVGQPSKKVKDKYCKQKKRKTKKNKK